MIASISVEFAEEREQPKQRGHVQRPAVPVLNIRGMDHRVQHQVRRIDKNATLPEQIILCAEVGLIWGPRGLSHFRIAS
jgi:hypothetical protein